MADGFYTVVVEGKAREAQKELANYFPEVRFLKTEPLDAKCARRCTGNRKLGNCIIRGCYYQEKFGKLGSKVKADLAHHSLNEDSEVANDA